MGKHKAIRQAGHKQGVQINVWIRRKRGKRSVVERTNQGPMVRLLRRLDGLDARRLRLHRLPSDHGAIAQEFGVPLIDVTAIFSVTLVMRLGGATASGWL